MRVIVRNRVAAAVAHLLQFTGESSEAGGRRWGGSKTPDGGFSNVFTQKLQERKFVERKVRVTRKRVGTEGNCKPVMLKDAKPGLLLA